MIGAATEYGLLRFSCKAIPHEQHPSRHGVYISVARNMIQPRACELHDAASPISLLMGGGGGWVGVGVVSNAFHCFFVRAGFLIKNIFY